MLLVLKRDRPPAALRMLRVLGLLLVLLLGVAADSHKPPSCRASNPHNNKPLKMPTPSGNAAPFKVGGQGLLAGPKPSPLAPWDGAAGLIRALGGPAAHGSQQQRNGPPLINPWPPLAQGTAGRPAAVLGMAGSAIGAICCSRRPVMCPPSPMPEPQPIDCLADPPQGNAPARLGGPAGGSATAAAWAGRRHHPPQRLSARPGRRLTPPAGDSADDSFCLPLPPPRSMPRS